MCHDFVMYLSTTKQLTKQAKSQGNQNKYQIGIILTDHENFS